MAAITITEADIGSVIVATAGSLTQIEAVSRGSSGKFTLTDPTVICSRGSHSRLYRLASTTPRRVILANNNTETSVQPIPECNLLGVAVTFNQLRLDDLPSDGSWTLTTS